MFDPLTNLSGLLGILLDIVGTTVSAVLLPFTELLINPLLSIFSLFA